MKKSISTLMIPVSYKTAKILSPPENNFIWKVRLFCSYYVKFSILLSLATWLARIAWTPQLIFSPHLALIQHNRNEKCNRLNHCHSSGLCLNLILIILCQVPRLFFIPELLWRPAAVINRPVQSRTDFTLKCVFFCLLWTKSWH